MNANQTTGRYHFTPTRMAIIFFSTGNHKCWQGGREIEPLCNADGDVKLCGHCRGGWFLKKLKTELPPGPAIPLLGTYPKELEYRDSSTHTHMFIAALFTITKRWKQPKCPATENG